MSGGMALYRRGDQLVSCRRARYCFCGSCKFNFNLPAFAPYGTLLASPGTAHLAREESSLWAPPRWAGPGCSWRWVYYLLRVGANDHGEYIEKDKLCSGEREENGSWDDRRDT